MSDGTRLKALKRARTESAVPRAAGSEIMLEALGAGVLENLGNAVQKQEEFEAARLKA